MILWLGKKDPDPVRIRLVDLPFLTSALWRTHFLFSLVSNSLYVFTSPSNCGWGKGPVWALKTTLEKQLLLWNRKEFLHWLVSYLPLTLPFIHPSLGKLVQNSDHGYRDSPKLYKYCSPPAVPAGWNCHAGDRFLLKCGDHTESRLSRPLKCRFKLFSLHLFCSTCFK